MIIKRGDIFYANLDPVIGSEQGGIRPVLVLQNNVGNLHSSTIIVAPITTKKLNKSYLFTHQVLECEFLQKGSIVLLEQIRTIDKLRLEEYLGRISLEQINSLSMAIKISTGLKNIEMTKGK